ncbi:amidohydrolase family protein [Jiangella alba]|uniref:L-fuconolactonase n=1 Tax=Jiangella alba TaxID=561176 RepID=A0A1H5JEX9_9ACTN|nr:amidohydrolase family protein [Jiangella alba]SEE51009.1 L-fuconolactonase [Jiangella alba]
MSIIDAHHHLWDPAVRPYPWMTGPAAPLRRRFGADDLTAALAGTEVTATVVVQAVSDESETRDLLNAAADGDSPVAGVVGWTDLTAPDVADTLSKLIGDGGRLVAVRHQTHDERDPEWLLRPDVRRGLATLADLGLAFDLLIRGREVPAAVRLAKAAPELQLVVDHAAKPAIATGQWEPWLAGLTELAAFPQVSCKISGLVTEADPHHWREQGVVRYARQVIALFGPDRAMFGSDWPVCTLAATYDDVVNIALEATHDLSDADRQAVLGDTARRVYFQGREPCT